MRTRTTARVGIGVFLAAIILFLGTKYWVETRTLRAVDMPVSLSRGTIGSGTFNVNVHAFYSINIGRAEGGDLNCDGVGLKTRRISSLGELVVYYLPDEGSEVAENTTFGSFLGGFEGKPGRYNLEIEVLSDTGCLNPLKPRLYIIASNRDFFKWYVRYENAFWISFISGSIGLALLIIGVKESFRWRSAENNSNLSFFESRSDKKLPAPLKVTPVHWFRFFSQIGLLYSQILLLGISGVLVFHFAWGYDHPSQGLFVVVGLSPMMKTRTCGETWVVRIDARENWYLNSTKTSQKELADMLSQQLGPQTNCAVYLEADPSLPYAVAIEAIATIQKTRAKVVVLLTPKTKKVSVR